MIMSFCKKGLHSFLGFTSFVDSPPSSSPSPSPLQLSPSKVSASSVGLSTATGEFPRGPNVVESTAVSSPPPPPPVIKKDSGGVFGFVDEIGGGGAVVDGLMSCTESLGFESSDDLWADEWLPAGPSVAVERTVSRREEIERRRETTFPPPISSLNSNGQRSFFLRPMRSEGRLELAEVRIDRSEILRASREDGRLRLELIIDEEVEIEEQEQGIIEEEQELIEEGKEMIEEEPEMIEESHEEMQEEQDFIVERFQEEEQPGVGEWKIPVSSNGFGRCHEIVSHHHHHHHHNLWRQPCVPIR